MDPSLSVSNDPHHPPQFTAYPPFTTSFAPQNHPFFGNAGNSSAVVSTNNNHLFHAPPPPQTAPIPPNPSFSHPPYSEMICAAILALNEPDGSSKQAISRYIERIYAGIPPAHGALLTHHLKTLKNSGILMMVKKSYKFASISLPTSAAVAAAVAGLEPPRSDFNENQQLPDPMVSSAPQTQKRGRGRPPKPKPDVQQPPVFQTNGHPRWDQNELPVSQPEEIQPHPLIKRTPGRPRKDGALPTVKASSSGGLEAVKRRGRPPSGRAVGRERKPSVVSAPASVLTYVANGAVRGRGRPKKVDASVAPPPPANAEGGREELALVVAKRRGRPPKIGGVMRLPMKPKRGYIRTGKPVGRPRKNAVISGAFGREDTVYGELKKKFDLFQEKAKEIINMLKADLEGSENEAVVQAIQALQELTVTTAETTDEPQPQPQQMEEVQPEEEHHETETEPEREGQAQTEAEAIQEALF